MEHILIKMPVCHIVNMMGAFFCVIKASLRADTADVCDCDFWNENDPICK